MILGTPETLIRSVLPGNQLCLTIQCLLNLKRIVGVRTMKLNENNCNKWRKLKIIVIRGTTCTFYIWIYVECIMGTKNVFVFLNIKYVGQGWHDWRPLQIAQCSHASNQLLDLINLSKLENWPAVGRSVCHWSSKCTAFPTHFYHYCNLLVMCLSNSFISV